MIFLSFDIASRSLAYTLMFYDKDAIKRLNDVRNTGVEYLEDIARIINNCIMIKSCEVVDLTNGVKLKDSVFSLKVLELKKILNKINQDIYAFCAEINISLDKVKVLLEYQMSANYQANAVFNQIYYHFAEFMPIVINPCYKNKIQFSDDLCYSNFAKKYAKSYSANKAHTKENFLFFINSFNQMDKIKHIKSKNLDDAADSFLQIFAYINFY